ncbi:hypothetical protein OHC33_011040 [Knufia fluminis]|uniref:Uncharacterized protein n=1 Tax=Knufia fluminis TaxID=191047 RepID=A0AAN8E8X4_9EURO|nr:hypothetical protein OHC33_011040 [Knufia fluminis]
MGDTNASLRTSSATIFPNTDFIEWIRFTDPDKPDKGKIEGINAKPGPISAYLYDDNSIRLYYTGKHPATSGPFKDADTIQEIKLPNADQVSTKVATDWLTPASAKELNFAEEVSVGTRLSDPTSFLSLTLNEDNGGYYEAAVWKVAEEKDYFQYGAKKANGKWRTTKFQLQNGNN